jgi:hypothetical protein
MFAFLVIALGVFFIGLHYAAHVRMDIARFFSETTLSFFFIGFLIFVCGMLLLFGFYWMNRGVYYRVKMGQREHSLDSAVLRGYIEDYWKRVFPHCDFAIAVSISYGQKMEIYVELPCMSEVDHMAIMEKAESELSHILCKYIGYDKKFALSVLMKS